MLIRLIDVVLILLFGFISISTIEEESKVELPTSVLSEPQEKAKSKEIIPIAITKEGWLLVENESRILPSIDRLEPYLLDKIKKFHRIKARIRIDRQAKTWYLKKATKMCDKLGIEKEIEIIVKEGE